MKNKIKLEFCKISDPRYQEIRNRHYIDNRGCHGQQIHFLIYYEDRLSGIISGGSSVYGVKCRDEYFNIPQNKREKESFYLPAIVNNTVFRLENHVPNLATCVLAKFRRVSCVLWKDLYGVEVIGFETFVVEETWRKGFLYKADNWTYLGETAGSTKSHKGLKNKSSRVVTNPKMVFAIKTGNEISDVAYKSCWRLETFEEKAQSKKLKHLRKFLIGRKF